MPAGASLAMRHERKAASRRRDLDSGEFEQGREDIDVVCKRCHARSRKRERVLARSACFRGTHVI